MEKIKITDWTKVHESLDGCGFARVKSVLTPEACVGLTDLYTDKKLFRSTVNMERYRFGRGEYKYFGYQNWFITLVCAHHLTLNGGD